MRVPYGGLSWACQIRNEQTADRDFAFVFGGAAQSQDEISVMTIWSWFHFGAACGAAGFGGDLQEQPETTEDAHGFRPAGSGLCR
jgi:hypothetical protein